MFPILKFLSIPKTKFAISFPPLVLGIGIIYPDISDLKLSTKSLVCVSKTCNKMIFSGGKLDMMVDSLFMPPITALLEMRPLLLILCGKVYGGGLYRKKAKYFFWQILHTTDANFPFECESEENIIHILRDYSRAKNT